MDNLNELFSDDDMKASKNRRYYLVFYEDQAEMVKMFKEEMFGTDKASFEKLRLLVLFLLEQVYEGKISIDKKEFKQFLKTIK